MVMRVKKDHKSKNEYIPAGGVWVRNLTKANVTPLDINDLIDESEFPFFMQNEADNHTLQLSDINDELFSWSNIVIVNDGYDYSNLQHVIAKLPDNVKVIAVNGALAGWSLIKNNGKPINLYVVNNPYEECNRFMPKKNKYYPACVASKRTNHAFLKAYPGRKYIYHPSPTRGFGLPYYISRYVDDYRNPICAAISLSYLFKVEKLMLLCCDHCFEEPRPGAISHNDLWMYPQHIQAQEVISAMMHWLVKDEVRVSCYGKGPEFENAEYINNDDKAIEFFADEN